MRSTAFLFFFALVMPPVLSMGQETGKGSSTTLKKEAAPPGPQEAASAKKPDYSAESIIVERTDTVYRYAADGTGTREIANVVLIQSDAAARQYGVLAFAFAGDSQRAEIDYIRVRKPDGNLVETPSADAQEMPQEVTRQAPFYSDLKEKQVPVRNLAVGDRLEYKVRIIDTKAEVPGQFWGQEVLGSWGVILSQSIELHVPRASYVKVWSPDHPPAKTETGDEVVYRWMGSHLEPTVGKDGKAIQREIDPKGELPTMAWTTFKNWEAVGTWYRGLEIDRIVPDATVKAKAEELTAGKSTDAEKAQVLYNFVATQIRYIGVAFGIGRYQPHPASEVLRNQYGDCKDKHTLLAAMLSAAGLHPEAALIGAGIRLNDEVPSPAAFNHMITFVPVGGAPVWLDTTSELAPYQMLQQVIRDKQALVIPQTGTGRIEKTPAGLPFSPFTKFIATGTLTKDGTMKAQMEYMTRGDDEIVMRTLLRQVPRGQWNDLMQRLSQGFGFSGTTSNPDANRPDLTADPVKITYNYEREKTGDWDNHRIVPLFPVVFINNVDDKNPPKKYPIQLGEPRVETSTSTIKLPAGWGADLPAAIHQKTAFASFDKTYKIEGDTLTTERRIEVLRREVAATDWKNYKKWFDVALGDGEPFITLIPTATDKPSITGSTASAASLVADAYQQIQRGEPNAAQATLDKAKALNEKQQSLWSTYGYLNYERHNWDTAIEAYKKEIVLYPGTAWVYRALANAQINSADFDGAAGTLRTLVGMEGVENDDLKRAVAMLILMKHYDTALPALESLRDKFPEDESIQVQLGIAQIEAGHQTDGQKTLISLLNKTAEPGALNSGAYELAKTGIELDLAEKSAQKAVDALTTESSVWKLEPEGEEALKQRGKQLLLVAAWDTLGWVFYRQGKIDQAENYIRASWLNSQSAEAGLHLGELEEKRGRKQEALHFYSLAFANTRDAMPKGFPGKGPDLISAELREHINALKKSGASENITGSQEELTKLRTLRVGSKTGSGALSEYFFHIRDGKIVEINKPPLSKKIPDGDEMVRRANFAGWIPQGSSAQLSRKGTLNCHSGVCELVIHPM
ncbi:MAG TPA: DUF3857 domain-containing protein [Edaphobacter sp.]|nr:DUF3857 domain-containing protein [Edaphobacter sp.]